MPELRLFQLKGDGYVKPPSCQNCPLWSAPGPVPGDGDPETAVIIYIAQNPSDHEVAEKPPRPLVGPSGRVRNRQLFEADLRLHQLYNTNVVKCKTPGNRLPTPEEARCCRHFLDQELAACQADVGVLAGDFAMKAILGEFFSSVSPLYKPSNKKGDALGVMSRMGCVEVKDGRKWIATVHPAHVMRLPEFQFAAVDHLKKAKELIGYQIPQLELNLSPTDQEVKNLCEYVVKESREMADDIETTGVLEVADEEDDYIGGDQLITMLGVSARPYQALVMAPEQIPLMRAAFMDEGVVSYEHNGPFEASHLGEVCTYEENVPVFKQRVFGELTGKKFDTMLATHYLKSFAPKKLKPFCVSQYTYLPYYNRDLGRKVNMRLYNAYDALSTLLVAHREIEEMKKWGIYDLFMEIGQPLLPILETWRQVGLRCDVRKVLLFKKVLEVKIQRAEELIAKVVGPFFNWASSKQLAELLYDRWKLPPQYNKKKNPHGAGYVQSRTIDFDARKALRRWIQDASFPTRVEQHRIPLAFLQLIDYVSGEQTKLGFLNRVSPDGRIHPFYKAHGEESFRLSSTPNVQNFPVYDIGDWGGARKSERADEDVDPAGFDTSKKMGSLRSIIIPDVDEDWLLTVDFSQMQLWIYAAQFNVKWLLDVFESGDYLYGIVYEKLYQEPFFEEGKPRTKKNMLASVPQQRIRRAKAVPLGFLFGRTGEAVAEEYGWKPAEGRAYRKWWMGLNPELEQSYTDIRFKVQQQGYIRHAFGHLMWFPTKKLTEAINSHAQSNEAFIMMETILLVERELKRRGLGLKAGKRNRTALSVHDSLTLNVMEEHTQEVYEEIVSPIVGRSIKQLKGFRFKHEATMTKTWDWGDVSYDKWLNNRAANSSSY